MWVSYPIGNFIKITRLYSLFEYHFTNDFVFKGESHDFWECVCVLDGSICASGDERVYDIGKHGLIVHKPLELHKFHVTSKDGATLLIFSFDLTGETEFFKDKVFSLKHEQRFLINTFLDYLRSYNGASTVDFYNRYTDPIKNAPDYGQRVVSFIYQLLLSLYSDNRVFAMSQSEDALIFSDAVSYMNTHIDALPSIEEIAHHCSVGESTLKRIFHKFSGLGVHKYMLSLKINTAVRYLKEGMTVTEVSEALGFSSQAYFSYVFKRETGSSPTAYKAP